MMTMLDVEEARLPLVDRDCNASTESLDDMSIDHSDKTSTSVIVKKRELLAWLIIVVQACALCGAYQSTAKHYASQSSMLQQEKVVKNLSINDKIPSFHEQKFLEATSSSHSIGVPFYDPPVLFPQSAGLVSRVWHSNASPSVNPALKTGSCWCSGDDYCMCTPSLAIDMILTSGPDHVWMVKRGDTGQLALMGGFVEVAETVEEASRRELKEEMNIELPGQPLTLFGVYSDPKRDSRRHAVSVVYHLDIPANVNPKAGDDAKEVVRVRLDEVEKFEMFIDHKTVLRDFLKARELQIALNCNKGNQLMEITSPKDDDPFTRSVCKV
jgi:ADP-ribose pyrophosphatase YjhB (NUDIX family)